MFEVSQLNTFMLHNNGSYMVCPCGEASKDMPLIKEEIWQQKDPDDRLRWQVGLRLKQKSEDFDKLYRDHKKLETDYPW